VLTDREIATLIIFGGMAIAALFSRTIREALHDILRLLLNKYILWPLIVYFVYSVFLIWAASHIGWWKPSLIKDTIIVVMITGIGMLFSANEIRSGTFLVRKTVRNAAGAAALATFYINLSSFSVITEIMFQIILAIAAILGVFAKHQRNVPRSVVVFFDTILTIGGVILIIKTSVDFSELWSNKGWEIFEPLILSIWFPLMLIPFVYAFSYLIHVQSAIVGLRTLNDKRSLKPIVLLAFLLGIRISVKYAASFSGHWRLDIIKETTFRGTHNLMRRYRQSVRKHDAKLRAEKKKLKKYAGIDGVDEYGKRLDRREFKETRRALTDLAVFQVATYRNRGHYYEDPLIFLSTSKHYGLTGDLEVMAKVSKNKRSWYAWRRTVSGWVFAVGGNKDIDLQWHYDGPAPPSSYPGRIKDEWTTDTTDKTAINWTD